MKKWIVGIVIAVVALGLVAGGIGFAAYQASAQSPTATTLWGGLAPMMGGRGDGPSFGPMTGSRASGDQEGALHGYMIQALADGLGLTADDLESRVDSGETLATIAEDQGLTSEQLTTLWSDARQQALDAAVADGVLTQEQADWMLQHMESRGPNGGCPMLGGDDAFGLSPRGRMAGGFFDRRTGQP